MATETNTGLTYQEPGSLQTDVLQNAELNLFGPAIAGTVTRNFTSDANITLVAAEYWTSVLILTDTGVVLTAGRDVVLPAHFPIMLVVNNTAQTLTLKKSGQTGITVAASATATIASGAADVVEAAGGGGGMTNPMTTAGDIIVGGASGAPARLAAGTNGHVLKLAAGTPAWAAESGGGATLPWIDVTDAPYSATGDGVTDDTTAIQAAIDAAETAGGGVVYFPPGIYVINGALQDTSRSNAQLLLPRRDYVDTEQITIELRGAFPPPTIASVIGTTPVPDNHSIIKGTLNAGTGSLIGAHGPVGTTENFTNLFLRVQNLTFRMPSNAVLTACDFSKVAAVDVDNVVVDCGSYYIEGLTEPTTTTSFGIRCPSNNNGAYTRLGATNVVGFYKGYEFAEHTVGQQVVAWGCKQAFVFVTATNHASSFQRMMAVHCERGIVATGIHYVDISQYNTEHATTGWWVTDFDVDDASHFLRGSLNWHTVLAGTGVDETFTVNGAARIGIQRIGARNGIEQVSVSTAITFEGKHANKHIYHPSADTTARVWTIPANSSVPYPIGTAITFVNDNAAGVLTISITTDTLRHAGTGATGNFTIAANNSATAIKMTSTSWQIK